jgi:hypothetical protein
MWCSATRVDELRRAAEPSPRLKSGFKDICSAYLVGLEVAVNAPDRLLVNAP